MNWRRGFLRIWMIFSGILFATVVAVSWDKYDFNTESLTYYYSPSEDRLSEDYYFFNDEVEKDAFRNGVNEKTNDDGTTFTSRLILLDKIAVNFIAIKTNEGELSEKFRFSIWPHRGDNRKISDLDSPSERVKNRLNELTSLVSAKAAELRMQRIKSFIYMVGGYGIGLPLTLLAAGALVGWVIKGFKEKQGS